MQARFPLSVSDAELMRIGEANPGWSVERVAGEIVMSPTGSESGRLNARLTRILDQWAQLNGYVAFDSSTGFNISPADTLCPDGSLVRRDRWEALSAGERRGYAPITPDVIVELLSPSNTTTASRIKCERWRQAGASSVLLLNPLERSVETWGEPPAGFPLDWAALFDA